MRKKQNAFCKDDAYSSLLEGIVFEIQKCQYTAIKIVNQNLVKLYWSIGKKIVKTQEREKWSTRVVEHLALDLQKQFPNVRGFSSQNLWKMRQFYNTYIDHQRVHELITQVSWTHNITIINKCKDYLEKEFYIRMSIRNSWTKDVLFQHIENNTYQKTITNQTNFAKTLSKGVQLHAKLAIKDEYIFDFLEIGEEYTERELEKHLVQNIESFLIEIGDMFTFVRSQYRVEISDTEYFIDILLYHRRLRCLIAIELKIGKFLPEYVGKMQFYLSILDEKVRLPEEKPSIGIILCKYKDKTIVEYALKDSNKPIGIASYSIHTKPPKEFERELPNPEQIIKLIEKVNIREKQILNPNNLLSLEEKTNLLLISHKKVIEYVRSYGAITNRECQSLCKVKKKQATNILSGLVKKDILEKHGAGRGTKYTLRKI